MTFNKEAFSKALKLAQGKRSLNQYAKDVDISAAHISRLIRCLIDTPPAPDTIKKLSTNTQNGIDYTTLMIAAGHLSEGADKPTSDSTESTTSSAASNHATLQKEFLSILIPELYQLEYPWSFEKTLDNKYSPDIKINFDGGPYKSWLIELKSKLPDLYRLYGQISILDLAPSIKFIIAVDSEQTYNKLKQTPPLSLRGNIFIMLVDFNLRQIIKEEPLCHI